MSNELEEKLRSIRPSDKLGYKFVLTQKVNECLCHVGQPDYGQKVLALKDAMYFDLPGMPWKTLIDKEIHKLKKEMSDVITEAIEKNPGEWAYPWVRMPILIDVWEQYYHCLMEFCIDTLARFNALIEPQDFVDRGGEFDNE